MSIFQRKWGENPPLSRNCNWEDSAIIDHWETGKIGRKIALKPGNFGILRFCINPQLFSSSEDRALRKCLLIINW